MSIKMTFETGDNTTFSDAVTHVESEDISQIEETVQKNIDVELVDQDLVH